MSKHLVTICSCLSFVISIDTQLSVWSLQERIMKPLTTVSAIIKIELLFSNNIIDLPKADLLLKTLS